MEERNKKRKALTWGKKQSAVYNLENGVNESRRYAISKLTENGKYIRGGQLYYSFNGVDIYSDIDDIMFVDLNSNSIFIRNNKQLEKQIGSNNEDPENRTYVLLLHPYSYDDNGDMYSWESIIGRTATYEWIKSHIDIDLFDPESSLVLTPNVALKDAFNVIKFMQHLKNANLVEEDEFDIEDYISSFN